MEDNPTKYYEIQFLLPVLSPIANLGCLLGSFKVWCSHHDFQKKNIQKTVCLKKASGPKLSTLGNVKPLKRHVTAPPSHAWPCPRRGCCSSLLLCTQPNKTFLLETDPGISFRPICCFDEDVQNLLKVCASRESGLHFSGCGSCCPGNGMKL